MPPKGVYPHTHVVPRVYPPDIVAAVRRMYLDEGMTVREVQAALPPGYKAQRIIERHVPQRHPAAKRDQTGDRNASWTDAPTYTAAHLRVRSARGPASTHPCVGCGSPAVDWSYDHSDPAEFKAADGTRPFSANPAHYSPRCRRCHRAFDAQPKEVMPHVS